MAVNGASLEASEQTKIEQFVCFKLASEEYAFDIKCVQEVIRIPRITPVPQMPDFCLGVINIRGNVVPLFDLRRKFHLSEKAFDANSKILVVAVDNMLISMVVDEILDNIKLESSQIDPAPTVRMNIERECIKGLGEMEGRMIAILDLQKIHDVIKKDVGAQSIEVAG